MRVCYAFVRLVRARLGATRNVWAGLLLVSYYANENLTELSPGA